MQPWYRLACPSCVAMVPLAEVKCIVGHPYADLTNKHPSSSQRKSSFVETSCVRRGEVKVYQKTQPEKQRGVKRGSCRHLFWGLEASKTPTHFFLCFNVEFVVLLLFFFFFSFFPFLQCLFTTIFPQNSWSVSVCSAQTNGKTVCCSGLWWERPLHLILNLLLPFFFFFLEIIAVVFKGKVMIFSFSRPNLSTDRRFSNHQSWSEAERAPFLETSHQNIVVKFHFPRADSVIVFRVAFAVSSGPISWLGMFIRWLLGLNPNHHRVSSALILIFFFFPRRKLHNIGRQLCSDPLS